MAERLDPRQLDGNHFDGSTLPGPAPRHGVVLPQMVVTIALETDEAKAAVDAVGRRQASTPARPPRRAAATPASAPSPTSRTAGTLPNGTPALVVRADGRALVGAGVVGTDRALWVEAEPVDETRADRARRGAGPRVPGRVPRRCSSSSAAAG